MRDHEEEKEFNESNGRKKKEKNKEKKKSSNYDKARMSPFRALTCLVFYVIQEGKK